MYVQWVENALELCIYYILKCDKIKHVGKNGIARIKINMY